MKENKLPRDVMLLGLIYLLMHGGILFIPNAIFWDDWVITGRTPTAMLDIFRQSGAMFNLTGHLHTLMLGAGLWTYRLLTFVLMFLSGMLLRRILANYGFLPEALRFYIVLLFLILPFNMARVALIDFPYTLCYFLFFLAWYLMERQRVAALALFFLSFNTNSLLAFYLLPVLDAMYRGGYLNSLAGLGTYVRRRLDFILLPCAYFAIKVAYYRPYGDFQGYNDDPGISKMPRAMYDQLSDLANFSVNPTLIVLVLAIVILFVRSRKVGEAEIARERSMQLLALGILAMLLAGMPYWSVAKVPSFHEWNSRHQLLFPLGSALTLVAILSLLKKAARALLLSVIVAVSLSFGIEKYYSFMIDWKKQEALVDAISQSTAIAQAEVVVFVDNAKSLNAFHRDFRFYEWNGLMERALGDQERFGIEPRDYQKYLAGEFDGRFKAIYKAGSHQRRNQGKHVIVEICKRDDAQAVSYFMPVLPRLELIVREINPEAALASYIKAC